MLHRITELLIWCGPQRERTLIVAVLLALRCSTIQIKGEFAR